MEIRSLASGSSGNAYIITHRGRSLLLDAGLSGRRTQLALKCVGIDPASITAILLTHEHNDHIAGAGVLCRSLDLPLYMTAGTLRGAGTKLGKIPADKIHLVSSDQAFILNDLKIMALPACHDALEPVNFLFCSSKHRAAVITDTGYIAENLIPILAACNAIVLEANHDRKMLENGPYPRALKERVSGDRGHLSNQQAARVLARVAAMGNITQVCLGHLSAVNNNHATAKATVAKSLAAAGMGKEAVYHNLKALPRCQPGPVLQIK